MLSRHAFLTRACVSTLMIAVAFTIAAPASDEGQAAADQVTEASYRYFLGDTVGNYGILYTHNGHNRGVGGAQHDLARDNIKAAFESYGLTVTLDPVVYSSQTYYNVVGTKLGTVHPDQEWIIGAHYDSVNNPGADDNASGVSLVLECARILTQWNSDYTIRFIAFTREEQGLYGSEAYVNHHSSDNILGMISLDMVAYDTGGNSALIYGHDNPALPLKTALRNAVAEYSEYSGASVNATDAGWNGQSDHAPFDEAGYQACLLIEGQVWSNPYYHTQQDSVDNLSNINYEFAVRMTKSVCGFLVDAAGVEVPVDTLRIEFPDGRPEFSSPAGGTPVTVHVYGVGSEVPQNNTGLLYYDVGSGWQAVPMVMTGTDLYEARLPAAECETIVRYFVSVDAMSGVTYTNPRSAPDVYYTSLSAYGRTVEFEDNFNTNQGWTVQNSSGLTAGAWQRGIPVGGGDRGDPPTDYDGSGYCYLTGNAAGDSDVDGGYTWLISPTLDLGAGDADITFALWYTNNFGGDPNNDLFKIYVSNDGGTNWVLVETVGPQTSAGWNLHTFTVGEFVTPNANVKVRFEASDLGTGSVVEAAVDAFSISNLVCEDPNPCFGDLDGDDDIDIADLAQLLAHYGMTGASYSDGDLDDDGDVDIADLAALLSVYGTTCE